MKGDKKNVYKQLLTLTPVIFCMPCLTWYCQLSLISTGSLNDCHLINLGVCMPLLLEVGILEPP